MAEPKKLELLLNTSSPIGEACVFKDGQKYFVFYKQQGFLPRSISTTDEAEVKNFLLASRAVSEGNYNRIMDPETPPVIVEDITSELPGGEDDGFDEVVEM